ncbi:hypothetical protein NQ318_002760, partial [Aromia moschata]
CINIARSNKPVSIFIICLLRNVSFVRRHSLIDLVFRYFCACICLIHKREKIVYMHLQKNPNLRNKVCEIFNVPNQLRENVIQCGEEFVRSLYPDGPKFEDINNLRHHLYNKAMTRQSPSALLDLSSLPPTKAACAQHSLRVYLQVQEWLGNRLPSTEWGWKLVEGQCCLSKLRYLPHPNHFSLWFTAITKPIV